MESAGAGIPVRGVKERVQEHAVMLHHQMLRPCAFFSKKLSPAEWNFDVGDWELLAVVKALKAWRHWLEGAKHPFLIWTDHRNLEYIRAARRIF
jgi:hypothetical protein